MNHFLWLSLWLLTGLPFATLVGRGGIFAMRKSDYAYYLEWKGFPKWRITFGKALTSIILGGIFVSS